MKPIVIHQTDLFHSHNDPDDHWDLACQYALAFCGDIELGGILIDYPPMGFGDPAIQAVNQMNYITGLSVPAAVGIAEPMKPGDGYKRDEGFTPGFSGVDMVLKILEKSPEPVIIHMVGSCRDIAIAAKLEPALFREKCGAVYLCAGASSPDSKPEYNVSLDPYSYGVIFGLECPVYWMPCFERAPEPPEWKFEVGRYGTFYTFIQGEILPYLSEKVKKYFLYALGKITDNRWLSYVEDSLNERMLEFFCKAGRSMYNTGGFFNAAGKTVTRTGEIADLSENPADAVFTFEPAEITCDEKGSVKWHIADKAARAPNPADSRAANCAVNPKDRTADRYIFRISDMENYPRAMTQAVKTLLMKLP